MAKITNEYSCTLVGRFMKEWAFAEAALDEVIATALKIDTIESWVLSTTITLHLKWNISKSLINLSQMSVKDKQKFMKMEKEFNNLSRDRNLLAHCMFVEREEKDVVKFLQIAHKGTIKSTVIEWSEGDFMERVERIKGFEQKLKIINKKLKDSNLLRRPTLSEIMSSIQPDPFTGLLKGRGKDS